MTSIGGLGGRWGVSPAIGLPGFPFAAPVAAAPRKPAKKHDATDVREWLIAGVSLASGILLHRLVPRSIPKFPNRFVFGQGLQGADYTGKRLAVPRQIVDDLFQYSGKIGFPVAVIEMGLRAIFGYEQHLSVVGGIAGMMFFQRFSIQYGGLDRSGTKLFFFLDRGLDALAQRQSGEDWSGIDFYKMAMRYGTLSLLGQMRAKWVRNLVFGFGGGRTMSCATMKTGSLASGKLAWGQDSELLKKLLRASNHYGVTTLHANGITRRFFGGGRTRFTYEELQRLATLLGKGSFGDLFAHGSGAKVRHVAGETVLRLKLGGDINWKGFLAFMLIQEPLTGPWIDGTLGTLLRGEDFDSVVKGTLLKGFTVFPIRHAWKLKFGVDRGLAVAGDKLLKYPTEGFVTKLWPVYATLAPWTKHYHQAIAEKTLDGFLEFHVGPKVWQGGLCRYNFEALRPVNLVKAFSPDGPVNNGNKRESFFTPIPVAYRKLADVYADPDKLTLEDRSRLEAHIAELIAEARERINGGGKKRSKFDDATIIEEALAISAAVYYANRHNPAYFSGLVEREKEWFDRWQKASDQLDDVERYVENIKNDSKRLRMVN